MGDTHDVRGTFEICSDNFELKRTVSTPEEFIELLQNRHAVILRGRPDKEPGLFKKTDKKTKSGCLYSNDAKSTGI
tara:strand:- start:27083 stop:27310 length:228 start_codon:yes stop_codon:yes gene_type:complete